ncbi:MAG: putative XRE-type DNA-binding protein [Motiliproteus sp.]|jgi:predicted XRE-type DNA-binding protein
MTTTYTTASGGNIFEDLGFDPAQAKTLKMKSELMIEVAKYIKNNGLSQVEAGRRMHVSRTRINNVVNGKVENFTIDALVKMLSFVGKVVELRVA